ncbi:MAG TPA: hypothetical protein VGC30_14155 [Dokdonella sp.]
MTFTMLRGVEPLLVEQALIRERLAALAQAAGGIAAVADAAGRLERLARDFRLGAD